MKRLLVSLVGLVIASLAIADDLVPPPWRVPGLPLPPTATVQEWTWDRGFQNPNDGTADQFLNEYGIPTVVHPGTAGPYPILPMFEGREKVLCLDPGRRIEFKIPNVPHAPPTAHKEVWMQITYFAGSGAPLPVPIAPPGGSAGLIGHMPVPPGGWMHSTFSLTYPDCPPEEVLAITNGTNNPVYIDQVVIDTICVPEPASMAILGAGLVSILARRKRRI